jgi:hypothetical protein
LYEKAGENDKEFLKEIIEDIEKGSSSIKQELDKLTKEVHKLEMEFLSKGIIIHDMEQEETSETADSISSTYKFEKKEMGEIPYMEVEIPKPKFDYSFKVLKEGQFALDNTLPEGLVYQIQIAVLSSKAKTKELKGLSPVFVKKLSSGKYLHTVGLFRTHAEALSNLNTVRKRGFSSAFIVAFNNGESISVKKAKNIEKNQNNSNGHNSNQIKMPFALLALCRRRVFLLDTFLLRHTHKDRFCRFFPHSSRFFCGFLCIRIFFSLSSFSN